MTFDSSFPLKQANSAGLATYDQTGRSSHKACQLPVESFKRFHFFGSESKPTHIQPIDQASSKEPWSIVGRLCNYRGNRISACRFYSIPLFHVVPSNFSWGYVGKKQPEESSRTLPKKCYVLTMYCVLGFESPSWVLAGLRCSHRFFLHKKPTEKKVGIWYIYIYMASDPCTCEEHGRSTFSHGLGGCAWAILSHPRCKTNSSKRKWKFPKKDWHIIRFRYSPELETNNKTLILGSTRNSSNLGTLPELGRCTF